MPRECGASNSSAERVGFEPTVQCNPYDDLANRSFRPLRHLSVLNSSVFLFEGEAKIKINSLHTQKKQKTHPGNPKMGAYELFENCRKHSPRLHRRQLH